ncbi:hypothetical protein KBK19_14995 [Microvirga sp. STR05]|uniref:Curlin n=1 Tax=Hymenobacter duratus TaxID=2771356 RepID=A0ABR8JKH1_9BACT|nr:hypothetical protein [Hymenobacter duratus]MBD2716345.1 hypothetical protein [Hymenobacter duratus]MBR7951260.1 hypothetical protein [Microvirga sp. STR05]
MKKLHILVAALLVSGSAFAQGPQGFTAVNACVGCPAVTLTELTPAALSSLELNPNSLPTGAIDNCSIVQQGDGLAMDDNNRAVVDQSGTGNSAVLRQQQGGSNYGRQDQNGTANRAATQVWGSNNTTLQLQNGTGNVATINVDDVVGSGPGAAVNGDGNWAQQRQSGSANRAKIDQYGDFNIASQDQSGDGNYGVIRQESDRSQSEQLQIGNSNIASTDQGRGRALDNGQRSCIEQRGDGNSAIVRQDVR